MLFKTTDLIDEFNSSEVSPYLRAVTFELARFWKYWVKKKMTVTGILRDPHLQVKYCKKYGFKSQFQHCAGEAIDFRSSNLDDEDIERLGKYVNVYLKKICLLKYHSKGTGAHLHLNLIGDFTDKANIWAVVKNAGAEEWFTG